MTDEKDQPRFASRWSRLKQEARAEPEEVAPEEPALPAEDDRSDAEVLEELGLPDPDMLKPGDDFTGFMAKAVPARLRTRALRKLWISNPVLANLDELVDYGEDFTDAATVIEDLQTVYQAGKGYVQKAAEIIDDGAGAEESTPLSGAGAEPGDATDPATSEADKPERVDPPETAPGGSESTEAVAEVPAPTTNPAANPTTNPATKTHARQRMRFRVAEE